MRTFGNMVVNFVKQPFAGTYDAYARKQNNQATSVTSAHADGQIKAAPDIACVVV